MSGTISSIGDALGYGQQASDDTTVVIGRAAAPGSEPALVVNGLKISGWTEVQIRCGLEIMPWSADLIATEWQPDSQTELTVSSGDPCQIYIGNDLVITGYIVTVDREFGGDSHSIHISVASKSIDLVESCAEIATYQINNMNALSIIRKIAATAGIEIYPVGTAGAVDIGIFSIIMTETGYEAIERLCRWANCLFYDRPDGNIELAPAPSGTRTVANAFVQGVNVEAARSRDSQAGRFATIQAIIQATFVLTTKPDEADYVSQFDAQTKPVNAIATDPGVTRPGRRHLIPVEIGDANYEYARRRVQWEVNRRYGRSQVIELTCDSWRDASGTLWAVNSMAEVKLDALRRGGYWLVVELVFRRDESGTHCDVTLMPAMALTPEPIILPTDSNEFLRALGTNNTTPTSGAS